MKRRALLIGINQYRLLGELRYARQDAEAVAEALCRYCGFTDQDVTLMSCSGEGAMLGLSSYIEYALMDLTRCRDLDLVVFGFWGHGFAPQAGRRYLCGLDAAEHDLERTAVSFDVIKAKLAQVQAENTLLVLDCCQNRPVGRSVSAEPMTEGEEVALFGLARDIQAAHGEHQIDSVPTVAILNACREGQKAYEWETRGHGIFTAHFLDALAEGFRSVAPLSSWVFDRVARSANDLYHQQQTPYVVIEGKGDIALGEGAAAFYPSSQRKTPPADKPNSPPVRRSPRPSPRWWVVMDGEERGPLDGATIRQGIMDGSIQCDAECWRHGMDQWEPIGKVTEWSDAFALSSETPAVQPPARKPAISLPDYLEPVADAQYARLGGLNPGSEAAQKRQMEWVEKGYALEANLKGTGILLRLVPPGEFQMGARGDDSEASDDEKPQHQVKISLPLYVGKFPVTQQQWHLVMGRNPSHFQTGMIMKKGGIFRQEKRLEADTREQPVESVSWDDCQTFLNRIHDQLVLRSDKVLRLPTEAEWEYACRAGTVASRYANLDAVGWFGGNSGSTTHPVGEKSPNAWGLHDMIGNVWEWCEDAWHDEYEDAPSDGTAWTGGQLARVLRGGSWFNSKRICRSPRRIRAAPGRGDHKMGFRVVVGLA